MTLEEIIAEMQRKPDAQILLEWIEDNSRDGAVREAVNAYFEAIES